MDIFVSTRNYAGKLISGRVLLAATLLTEVCIGSVAGAQVEYRFERMWPTLEQPWYFNLPVGIVVTSDNTIIVNDSSNLSAVKLSGAGQFISRWGSGGFSWARGVAWDDISRSIFVADTQNHRIRVFDSDGNFVWGWGTEGGDDGELQEPYDIAVSVNGDLYVADTLNHRIQRFDATGGFVSAWGSQGTGPGQFSYPQHLAIAEDGSIYVADTENFRIQKFDASGQFLLDAGTGKPRGIAVSASSTVLVLFASAVNEYDDELQLIGSWGGGGVGAGEFRSPDYIDAAPDGFVYVSDTDNNRVQKFTAEGVPVVAWGSSSLELGGFNDPRGIDAGPDGSIYVVDHANARVQRFDSDGVVLDSQDVGFPIGVAVNASGLVYVTSGSTVKRYDADLAFISEWSDSGWGVAAGPDGSVYVAVTHADLIRKYDGAGTLQLEWGGTGTANGHFNTPTDVAVGPDNTVYVADNSNDRIQKFDAGGSFITKWGSPGSNPGEFSEPIGIATGPTGLVYVVDQNNQRIQVFSDAGVYLSELGTRGRDAGRFTDPYSVCVNADDEVYIADRDNNRIQKFVPVTVLPDTRAIVVAAGGPSSGTYVNHLWDATQYSANFAYTALAFQGFTKDRIYYLSADTDLDLDQNGLADDVDGDATKANFQYALETWAPGADSLVVYLVDHGGEDQFRLSASETLSASQLGQWVDTADAGISGLITVVYDACQSGSFLTELQGANRLVMTSATGTETAKFISVGTISFSSFFWEQVFNGSPAGAAFSIAQQAMAPYQTPQISDPGSVAATTYIGSGTDFNLDKPAIGGPVGIAGGNTIDGTSTATIFAEDVTDASVGGGINRVWAVLRPPSFIAPSPDNPILDFPTVELSPVGGDRFEGTYTGFTTAGIYNIVVYALDNNTETSLPALTTLTVTSPLRRRAIIAIGTDSAAPEWPVAREAARQAYETLLFQQYLDDAGGGNEDIKFYSPVAFSAGVDGTLTQSNLEFAIETWAAADTQDLTVFLIGPGTTDSFRLNASQTLAPGTLDGWLDTLQGTIPGVVTVIYDGHRAGSFADNLVPPSGKKRIFMASTSATEQAAFVQEGGICFSRFFWRSVSAGANAGVAFTTAKLAISGFLKLQTPGLDDTGNGVVNEKLDGPTLARRYSLGTGIITAGDAPSIAGDTGNQSIASGTVASFGVTGVTSTGTIAAVWALVMPPGYGPEMPQLIAVADLLPSGGNNYAASYAGFTEQGDYTVAVFAEDVDSELSLPRVLTVTQPSGAFAEASTAESLRDNFGALDTNGDGGLTLAEAQVQVTGLTQDLFNQLDDNSNGKLSMAELLDASVGTAEVQATVYVDFAFDGVELGTAGNPFNSAVEGAAYVAVGGELFIGAGQSAETLSFDRPMTVRANGGTARLGSAL